MGKISKSLIFGCCGLFVVFVLLQFIPPPKNDVSNDVLQDSIAVLNRRLLIAGWEVREWRTFEDRIRSLHDQHYDPDSIAVFYVTKILAERYPSVTWADIDTIAKRESDWGFNKRVGALGERGWSQIMQETMKSFYVDMGGDPATYDPKLFNDCQSVTELTVRMVYTAKILRGEFDYQQWNRGVFAKVRRK